MTQSPLLLALLVSGAAGVVTTTAAGVQTPSTCPEQVIYLSDTEPAYRYLEQLQREIYTAYPELTDPFSRDEARQPRAVTMWSDIADRLSKQGCDSAGRNCVGDAQLYKEMLEKIRCKPLPTRFESPIFMLAIETLGAEALAPIRTRDYPKATAPRYGSLPSVTIDAEALMPPNVDRPIIILNRDVFFFTGAFSKAISDAVPIETGREAVALSEEPEAIGRRLEKNPHIVEHFADAMSRMILAGTSRGATEVMLDADHNRLHSRLVTAMDTFILAHEEAHVIRQDLSKETVSRKFLGQARHGAGVVDAPAKDPILTVQVRTREQELAADELGYRLLLKTIRGTTGDGNPVDVMVGASAPYAIFRVMDAADSYHRVLTGQRLGDANHPSAAERVKSLGLVYEAMAHDGGELEGYPDFRRIFGASLDALLLKADPLIRKRLGLPAQ